MLSALFTDLLFQLALLGVSVLSTYGILFLFAGNLIPPKYMLLLSSILLPPIAILCLSAFGFFSATQVSLRIAPYFFGAGLLLTLVVLILNFPAVQKMCVRVFSWPLLFGILGMISHDIFNATNAFSYNYQGNGEFLNYAKLATFITGARTQEFGGAFVEYHHSLRYGQDIWLGLVATLFNKHPIEIIHIGGGYLRFAYGVGLGIIASSVLCERRSLIFVLILYSISSVELFSYNASFLSSNIYIPYAMLWAAALLQFAKIDNRNFIRRLANFGLFFSFYIFGTLTYPEFHVPAIIFLAGYFSVAVLTRRFPFSEGAWLFLGLFAPLVFLFFFNSKMLTALIHVVSGQAGSGGGWNIFSDPKTSLVEYLSFILGLKFRLGTNEVALPSSLAVVAVLCASLTFVYGALVILFRRNRFSCIFGLWMFACLLANVAAELLGSSYYAATKLILQTNFMVFIALGAALFERPLRLKIFQKIKNSNGKMMGFIVAPYVFLTCGVFISAIDHSIKRARIYDISQWKKIMGSHSETAGGYAIIGDAEGEGIWFMELAAMFSGTKAIPLSSSQLSRLERRPNNRVCENSGIRSIDHDYGVSNGYIVMENGRKRGGFYYLGDQSGAYFDQSFFGHRIGQSGDASFFVRDKASLVAYRWLDTEWMVNRVWMACITVPIKYLSLEFTVPDEMFVEQSAINFTLKANDNKLGELVVERPGVFKIDSGVQFEHGEMRLRLESSGGWVPSSVDSKSLDSRNLAASIKSLTLE